MLCVDNPNTEWIKRKSNAYNPLVYKWLTRKARAYLSFVFHRLIPCEGNTHVMFERVIVTYALMTKTDVNVGALMYREMEQTRDNYHLRLFFASTLTKYMMSLRILKEPGDEMELFIPKKKYIISIKSHKEEKLTAFTTEQQLACMSRMLTRIWLVTERDMAARHIDISDIMTQLTLDEDERCLFVLSSTTRLETERETDATTWPYY